MLPLFALCYSLRIDCWEKRWRRRTSRILHHPGSHERCARGRRPRRVQVTKGTLQEQVESDPRRNILVQCEKGPGQWIIWNTRSNAIILFDSVPADCVERVVNNKTKEILCQKASTLRTPPKIILKGAWQVQRADSHQHVPALGNQLRTRKRKSLRLISESKVPQTAVDQDEERTRRINRLAHMIKLQTKEKAQIKDRQRLTRSTNLASTSM